VGRHIRGSLRVGTDREGVCESKFLAALVEFSQGDKNERRLFPQLRAGRSDTVPIHLVRSVQSGVCIRARTFKQPLSLHRSYLRFWGGNPKVKAVDAD